MFKNNAQLTTVGLNPPLFSPFYGDSIRLPEQSPTYSLVPKPVPSPYVVQVSNYNLK